MILEFDNTRGILLEHDGRAYYIRISKYSRTTSLPDMKQSPQLGCSLGVGYVLEIKHHGLPAEKRWRLYVDGQPIMDGYTSPDGKYFGLPIQLPCFGIKQYGFELIAGQDSNVEA